MGEERREGGVSHPNIVFRQNSVTFDFADLKLVSTPPNVGIADKLSLFSSEIDPL